MISDRRLFTFIFHISMITVVICSVGDNLDPAIRQCNPVFSRCCIPISNFSMREIFSSVLIVDRVSKCIIWWSLKKKVKIFLFIHIYLDSNPSLNDSDFHPYLTLKRGYWKNLPRLSFTDLLWEHHYSRDNNLKRST